MHAVGVLAQVRVMLHGQETVLGDAAADCELFLTETTEVCGVGMWMGVGECGFGLGWGGGRAYGLEGCVCVRVFRVIHLSSIAKVYMCVQTCLHACTPTHTHARTRTHTYKYTYTHTCAR